MRGRIGIAHLSNFGLGVKSLFEVFPSTPRHFYKNSVRHSTVGQSYVSQLPSSKTRTYACRSFFRIGISQNSFLFVPTYFYAHTYGVCTENSASLFCALAHKKWKLISALSESIIRIRISTSSMLMFWWSYHPTFLHTYSLFKPLASCEGRNAQTNLEAASSASQTSKLLRRKCLNFLKNLLFLFQFSIK